VSDHAADMPVGAEFMHYTTQFSYRRIIHLQTRVLIMKSAIFLRSPRFTWVQARVNTTSCISTASLSTFWQMAAVHQYCYRKVIEPKLYAVRVAIYIDMAHASGDRPPIMIDLQSAARTQLLYSYMTTAFTDDCTIQGVFHL
jgi:hypothetical protein